MRRSGLELLEFLREPADFLDLLAHQAHLISLNGAEHLKHRQRRLVELVAHLLLHAAHLLLHPVELLNDQLEERFHQPGASGGISTRIRPGSGIGEGQVIGSNSRPAPTRASGGTGGEG